MFRRNHDIFWLQGQFHDSNKITDVDQVREEVVSGMKKLLLQDKIRGAHALRVHGMPLLFVHAGFRPAMVSYIQEAYRQQTGENVTSAEHLVKYVNGLVQKVAKKVIL